MRRSSPEQEDGLIITVAQIGVAFVKATQLLEKTTIPVTPAGLRWDRDFCLLEENGQAVSPANHSQFIPLRFDYDEASDRLILSMPDGEVIDCAGFTPFDYDLYAALGGERKERIRKRVDYDGYDGEHRRWTTFSLYGGMQFNHIVQGTARDVMVGGMLRAEAAGYCIVLTVHDEVLDESPEWFGSADELEALMTAGEPWLVGCPLAAKAWEGVRYAK